MCVNVIEFVVLFSPCSALHLITTLVYLRTFPLHPFSIFFESDRICLIVNFSILVLSSLVTTLFPHYSYQLVSNTYQQITVFYEISLADIGHYLIFHLMRKIKTSQIFDISIQQTLNKKRNFFLYECDVETFLLYNLLNFKLGYK